MIRIKDINSVSNGQLVILDNIEKTPVYVVWYINKDDNVLNLVELDRPGNGGLLLNINKDDVYKLDPLEVVECVTEWH